jgi:hypothetical protein
MIPDWEIDPKRARVYVWSVIDVIWATAQALLFLASVSLALRHILSVPVHSWTQSDIFSIFIGSS